ncbi:hypothetical protein MKEN_00809100 [Mycena kentingensis (nom. inval.)]|nr:hypothetical protein MKEN_00809100 [Mycena kentingensis (nom. inval.)]
MSANTNNRASLLAGLRTGGVRSAVPHTAAPGGAFNIPRIGLQPAEDDAQYLQFPHQANNRPIPQTAAVDGGFFQQQQNAPFSTFPQQPNHAQAQALQMQMMQIEIMRMQALQAQQYQAQLLAAQNQPQRRPNFNPPATATGSSFDLRSATLSAQMRRNQRQEDEQHVPMTAALDGKFGIRPNMLAPGFVGHYPAELPSTPQSTTGVISGGTSLGSPAPSVVSKSESASNWRRNNNSVLRGANRPAGTKTSPPPTEHRHSPPPAAASLKPRPGLSINSAAAQPIPVVAIDTSESENDDGYSTSSSDSAATNSPPTTPRSSSSIELTHTKAAPVNIKAASVGGFALGNSPPKATIVISRQPRGPPSEAAEFATRNFASRSAVTVAVAA